MFISRQTFRWLISRPREFSPRTALRLIVIVTLIGIGLRLAALNAAPALTDEAFTFWRICGSFNQMLDTLRNDAFVPLHYEAVWVLSKLLGQDVWVLRIPSAIAGIAMPYAVYRIGRIVSGRRVGVISAAVEMSSAYLAFYARNAKMYMPAWTLTALAIGSLLYFARARARTQSRRLAWLTFVLFGVAAASSHAVVCIPLAMSPLLAIAWSRKHRLSTFFLTFVGTAIVLAGPAIYYTAINTWFDRAGGLSGRSENGPAPRDNGLMWIDSWQRDRSPRNILIECLSAYTGGIEWPEDGQTLQGPLANAILQSTRYAMLGLATFATAAVFVSIKRWGSGVRLPHGIACLLLIGVPLYAFYLRSFRSLWPPWALGSIAWAVVGFTVIALLIGSRRHRFKCAIVWLIILSTAFTLTWAGAKYAYGHAPLDPGGLPRWNPLWLPRYSGFIAPLLCVMVGSIVAATPTRPLRFLLGAAVIGLNLWLTGLSLTQPTEMPWPQITRDVLAASQGSGIAVGFDWIYLPGQPLIIGLPSPYYALVRSANLDVDPPGFRRGEVWPYRPGPPVAKLLATLRYQPAILMRATTAKRPGTTILWRMTRRSKFADLAIENQNVVERHTYVIRSVWTWETSLTCERLVLKR